MSTVAEVTDRVFADWLYLPDDQPVVITFDGAVTASATTWTYNDATLAPDEEDLIAPGVVVEAGSEQARIIDVSADTDTLTVIRGINGTTAAAHSDAAEIVVAPAFSRHAVEEAVKDNVVALYPTLYRVATEQVDTAASYVEVPASVVNVRNFIWLNRERYLPGEVVLLSDFAPSSTGKAVQFPARLPAGRTGYLTYEAKFDRPSSASSELFDFGVEAEWERIVAIGAAAQVVASRPSDDLSVEYITEQLEREAAPPGTATDVRNGLLTLRSIWLDEARRSLNAQRQPIVNYNTLGS